MERNTDFRRWLNEIWRENCEEHRAYNQLPYSLEEYWQRYKYWLKREFKYQRQHGKKTQD